MRFLYFFFSILVISFPSSFIEAQERYLSLKIVSEQGEILPYACIFINEKHNCIADEDGKATIPITMLKLKDTISVTYIGMNTSSIEVSDSLLSLGSEETITLRNNVNYAIDPLVVTAKFDHWKFFNKNTISEISPIFKSIVIGSFEIGDKSQIDTINGSFTLHNAKSLQGKKIYENFFSEYPIIDFCDNAEYVSDDIKKNIRDAVSTSCQIISRINAERRADYKYSNITYLGEENDTKVFRIIYTAPHLIGKRSFQLHIHTNSNNHKVTYCEYYDPSNSTMIQPNNVLLKINYTYYQFRKKNYTLPGRIEILYKDETRIILKDLRFELQQ